VPTWLGWTVLTLVFVDEVAAVVALGYVGSRLGGWPVAILVVVVAVGAWWGFASPKAPWGGPITRPVAKVVVFGAACGGLAWAGHETAAVLLLVFSVVVNALAQLPGVRSLVPDVTG
jgi:hypothetical protein